MKPLSKIGIQWSPDIAYAIGLITTDGSLSKDGRHIIFVSKDIELIHTFKKCLGLKNKIGVTKDGHNEKEYYRVQFGDVNFYKWLLGIGLTPNKTKTIHKLIIPDDVFMDFLRGHLDGDGYFYSFWDKRWGNSFMFYTNFTSYNRSHVEWLQQRIKKLLNIQGHISIGKNTWMLRFAKKESRILAPKIYYKKNIPCLKRKKEKIQKHIPI